MTLKDFNDTIENMRKAYKFKDEETTLLGIRDIISGTNIRISIATYDKKTGTEIQMACSVKQASK